MREIQLIYTSKPFSYDDLNLRNILLVARRHNARDGISGALICREDVFVQMLEGPRDRVTATYGRILRDDRHTEVALLWSGDADQRLFAGWDMRHDPARSWMWSPDDVRRGAVVNAPAEAVRAVFNRIAREPYSPAGGAS